MGSRTANLVVAAGVLAAGCALEEAAAPALTGPSEFALSVDVTVAPDQLPRDGHSVSVVTVTVRDVASRPVAGQRLSVASDVGMVLESGLVTGADGRATVAFVAPAPGTVGNAAVIRVTPVGDNAVSAVPRIVRILLTGISNRTAPTPSFTVSPASPILRESVVFDATATTDEGTPCLDSCVYAWDFGGEAAASGRLATHEFRAVRTYPVTLLVTDAAGSVTALTRNVTVAQGTPPEAVFTYSPTAPQQFQTVYFTAMESQAGAGRVIVAYDWRFGDGSRATGVNASHAYAASGTYVVTLTVTDSAGLHRSWSASVSVGPGLVAEFTYGPLGGGRVVFNAGQSRGPPARECGIPLSAGTYAVALTVQDAAGRMETALKTVTVNSVTGGRIAPCFLQAVNSPCGCRGPGRRSMP